jgi:hypothetical protein
MGSLISCLACQGLSCGASLCTSAACCAGKALISKSVLTRLLYATFFFLAAIVMYILNFWSYKLLSFVPVLHLCSGDDRWCVGVLATARVCFAMVVFHAVMALFLIRVRNSSDFRAQIQDGWWLIKLGVIVALSVVAFFIPNEFFVVFGWITLFGAAAFIIVQLVLLIEFAYTWAEAWVANYQGESGMEENKIWLWLLMISTVVLYLASIAITIVIYVFFYEGKDSCWMNIAFPTINVALCALFSMISISSRIQEAHPSKSTGLLQSGVVTAYCTYLIYSAVTSEPEDSHCNPFNHVGGSLSSLLIGAAFTIVAVCFSTVRIATKGDSLLSGPDTETSAQSLVISEEKEPLTAAPAVNELESESEPAAKVEDDEEGKVTYNYTFFHITFMLGAMYVFMLITDWQTISGIAHGDDFKVDHGYVAVWVKLATSWLATALYIWTLVAPALFPDRDFS